MNPRAGISILVCSIGILTAQAQLTQEDSIRLKRMLEGKEEIIINQEAVKSIEFNFVPREELLRQRPMMAEDKPWMKFIKKLPKRVYQRPKGHYRFRHQIQTEPRKAKAPPLADARLSGCSWWYGPNGYPK